MKQAYAPSTSEPYIIPLGNPIMVKSQSMKAVEWEGELYYVNVRDISRPTIQHPLDAVIRLTTAGICGTDLHIYHGRLAVRPPLTLGHEMVGIIEEVGAGVTTLKKGDRVVVFDDVSCGYCYNCVKGLRAYCLTVNPPFEGDFFAVPFLGIQLNGGQGNVLRCASVESLTYKDL